MEHVIGVSLTQEFEQNGLEPKFRISVLHYNKNKERLDTHTFYFLERHDFRLAFERFDGINMTHRGGKKRNLCVLVNPISGRRLSREYFRDILTPMLEFNGIGYEMFETDSEVFIERFLEKLDAKHMYYTDFIVIGGDGIFNQLINSITKHPDKDVLLNIPIGFMPGGSSNALSCDLGSKDPFIAGINIMRGQTVKGDMFRVDMIDNGKTLYSTAMTYGYPCDLILESENLRNVFGRYRYIACGVKKFVASLKMASYDSEIYYKEEDKEQIPISEVSREKPTLFNNSPKTSSSINLPRVMKIKRMTDNNFTNTDDSWRKLPCDKYLFYAVVTHEIRSSINEEVFAPFVRVNDGKMYVVGVKECSKLGALGYLSKVSEGTHLNYHKFFFQKASALRIKNPEGAHF